MLMGIHIVATAFEMLVVLMPLIGLTLFKLEREELISRARFLIDFNRIQNVMLIISVITGASVWGTLYLNWWLMVVIALLLAFGAGLGFMNRALKKVMIQAEQGQSYQDSIRQYLMVSTFTAAALVALVIFKVLN